MIMKNEKSVDSTKAGIAAYAWVILAVVYFSSVVAPFNQFKVPPIMPVLMQAFGLGLAQAGQLMSIVAVIGMLLALPGGIMLQRWGPKAGLLIALGLMAIGAIAGALSDSFVGLLGSRAVEGLGIGLMGVTAPATIAMWFPPERQGTPMGIWATWVPVGTVAIYYLAPALAASFGWRSAWWIGAGFALVMMIFCGLLVTRPTAPGPVNAPVEHIPDLQAAFSNRNIWLIALEFACFNLVLVALGTYYPTFLSQVRGYSLEQAAFVSSIGTLLILFSAPAAGWLSDRVGSRRLFFSLPFLAIALLLIFPFRVTGWQIVATMVAQGIIAGAVPTASFAAVVEVIRKPQWAGLGLAAVLMGQNLGQLLGPVYFGSVVEKLGWEPAGYLLIPVCLIGFVCGWMVRVR